MLTDIRSVRDSLSPGSRCRWNRSMMRCARACAPSVFLPAGGCRIRPAEARHRVDLPHGAAQDAGEFLQGDVAGDVREPFVVFREAVDVEPQQTERSAAAAGAEDLLFELVIEVSGIVKMGQWIEESV
jgi:hypothetical protein